MAHNHSLQWNHVFQRHFRETRKLEYDSGAVRVNTHKSGTQACNEVLPRGNWKASIIRAVYLKSPEEVSNTPARNDTTERASSGLYSDQPTVT